jgi:ABC-2 type transport system ATP-binding protein
MGKTILISSHILHELAELCNAVGIIERGDLLYQGTVQDALRRAGMGKGVLVGVADRVEDAARLLKSVPGIRSITLAEPSATNGIGGQRILRLVLEDGVVAGISDIPNRLVNGGFRITHFAEEPVSLETAFMKLTKGLVQ